MLPTTLKPNLSYSRTPAGSRTNASHPLRSLVEVDVQIKLTLLCYVVVVENGHREGFRGFMDFFCVHCRQP